MKRVETNSPASVVSPTGCNGDQVIPSLPPATRVTTLENGLIIIVREDHSAPVVSAQAWAQTGSIHEGAWLGAGLSHVLEHMLFKGTTTRPASRIDQEVQEAGGYMNAYTSFDRTVYHIDVPNTGARTAVDILCDIMQHATLPADELAKELDVIRREMDMGHDDPHRRAGKRLFEVAYTKSPYRFPIIGLPDIFNQLTPDNITGYYRARYAPNNLFFVVAGDVKTDEVVAQIKQAFVNAKARPQPPGVLPQEPQQMAVREVIEEAPIELGHFHLSWHIPELRHPDVPVLDVLATLLGSGRSSRLFQQVREKLALAHSADAWTYNPGSAGLFGMSAVVDADKFAAARDAMLAEIERMKREPVSAAELAKAVKQFTAGTLASRKTMQGQAADLGGCWLAATDLNFSQRYLAAVRRITPEDLQRVAREYLTPENQTLYALLPEGTVPKNVLATDQASDHAIHIFELPNGLRLLVKEDHRLPFVEFRMVFKGGLLAESAENNGITLLLAKLMLKGTRTRNAEQIATEIESAGGSIDTYAGNNSFGVYTEVLSSDFATGLGLTADVILNPTFPAEALEREREVQIAQLASQRDQILQSGIVAMRRALFGERGYGRDSYGTEESLAKIQPAHLHEFHARLATPDNCVFAIYGDVNTADIRAVVEKTFGNWPRAKAPVDASLDLTPSQLAGIRRVAEIRDKKQAVLLLGYAGVRLDDSDRFALELIQEACSDLGSRLFLRIREKLGLAYYVGARLMLGLAPGSFYFYAGTAPETLAQVEAEMLKEAELLRTEGLSAEELSRAKAKLIGQKKISRQDIGSLASATALDELYGLGFANGDTEDARYHAVTLEEIKAVAQKYLRSDALVIATVKP
ncbi:MAG: insulinase family protein [Verrucomicrobia bacterium]|nr:insulinase family protein [Verrucomicrobiota bacterium]